MGKQLCCGDCLHAKNESICENCKRTNPLKPLRFTPCEVVEVRPESIAPYKGFWNLQNIGGKR